MTNTVRIVQTTRYDDGAFVKEEAAIPAEAPLTIRYNGREIITLLSTPEHLDELAVGFLASEGFLENPEDLESVAVDDQAGFAEVTGRGAGEMVGRLMEKRTITSGCGKGTTFYHALDALRLAPPPEGVAFSLGGLAALASRISREAPLHKLAGGIHHAALTDDREVLLLREDIGRHNAVDKLKGRCFLDGRPTGSCCLILSGRVSSEMLIKAGKLGVPAVVSISRATSLAVDLARRLSITLVGNLRGRRGVVYHDPDRLTA
jgi:FdhD protein